MRQQISLAALTMALGFAGLSAGTTSAQAQIFCPPNASAQNNSGGGGNTPFALSGGACTNGVNGSGAFSGAAVASQALSGLTQTTTAETNRQTSNAVGERRTQEANRCPAGQVRTASGCAPARAQGVRPATGAARMQMQPTRVRMMVKGKPVMKTVMRRVPMGGPGPDPFLEPVPMLLEAPRYGAFLTGFSDYERRTGNSGSSVTYNNAGGVLGNIAIPPGLNVLPLAVSQQSVTKTGGFVGGIDMTFRNNFAPGDGAIFGLLAGYTDTSIRINTQSLSLSPFLASGAARTAVSVRGASVGGYFTYFSGPFSFDHTLKIDLFRLNESFTEVAGFGGVNGATQSTLAGFGSTALSQVSSIGNAGWKFPVAPGMYIEPTIGYQYTASFYGGGGAQLGLNDGDLLRLQGGARIGVEGFDYFGLLPLFGIVRSTTTLTGLVYDNVFINGGFIQGGAFGGNTLTLNDAHKVRGQGILATNYEFGNGFSVFSSNDVRGGNRFFGYGSKIGVRYEW